jgi:uncharacterized repeat protein (TIGR01451 family)
VSDTATITAATQTLNNTGDDTASESTMVVRQVDLAVSTMESIDPVIAGSGTGNLTYTITVTNNGPSDASGVVLSEDLTLPAGVTFTPTTAPDATWSVGNLAALASATLTVVLTVGPSAAAGSDVISSQASVAAVIEPESPSGNNSSTILTSIAVQADLAVSKTDLPDPVLAGGDVTYTITVSNAGPSDAQNVSLSDVIPANTTFVSAMQTSGPAFVLTKPPVGGTGTFTATASTLAAGASATFTLVVNVNSGVAQGSVITNTATASTTTPDPNAANDSDIETTMVAETDLYAVGADAGGTPHVRVFSGANAAEKYSFFAYSANFTGGVRVAMGDVNGDGVPDIITGAGPGGGPHVRVFSGLSGAEIGSFFAYNVNFSGGVFVASADFNNDGFADILTGADAGGGPHVRVFSGASGAELASFFDPPKGSAGVRVASGDINGDGTPDIITGTGPGVFPVTVRVFNGLTAQLISGPLGSFEPYPGLFQGGAYIAAGDVDGDGRDDVITGAGAGGGPHVKAFSGLTGAEIASFYAYSANFTGGVRVGVGDVNRDGLFDIITGAGPGGGPHVRAFSGAGGTEILSFFPFNPAFPGGVFVAGAATAAVSIISPPEQPGQESAPQATASSKSDLFFAAEVERDSNLAHQDEALLPVAGTSALRRMRLVELVHLLGEVN